MKNAAIVAGLAASASAFSLRPRDTATVLTDFQNITTQVNTLTTNLNAINSNSNDQQLTDLINAVQNLDDAISKGIADAEATSPVDEAQGCSVLEAVLALIPTIYESLNAATNKAPIFANYPGIGDISGVVQGDFSTLSSLTNQFATALIAVAPAVDDAAATAAVDCINSGFVSAFATELATPSCTTGVVLPCSASSSASATSAPITSSVVGTSSASSGSSGHETTCTETGVSSSSATYTSYPVESSSVSSSAPVYTSYPVSSSPESTTSTVYSTYVSTIYECASSVTDCPYRTTSYSVAVSTTVCPVTSASYPAGGSGSSASYPAGGSGSSASYPAGGSGSSASYPAGGSGSSYPSGGAGGYSAGSTGSYQTSSPSGYPAYTGAASALERSTILGSIFAVVAFFL